MIGMDLGGEILGADDRRQDRGDRPAIAVLDRLLGGELPLGRAARAVAAGAGQEAAILVDHRDAVRAEAGHGRGDEVDDRLHLAVAEAAAGGEGEHHRSGGIGSLADEHARLLHGEMDARGLDDVDRLDRAGEIGLAGAADALGLDRAAGAERHRADHLRAVLAAARQAALGGEHAGAVIIVLRHVDRAGGVVDRIGDAGAGQRLDDLPPSLRPARLANKARLGAALKIIHSIAARPSIATMPTSGRLLATAGWARKPRRPPAALRKGEAAAGRGREGRWLSYRSYHTGMLMMSL